MVVVGDRSSANSATSLRFGGGLLRRVYFVENADELDLTLFRSDG
jgi:4-hydroxy-3-methylbut-2-enyl diphosphate reductase IspH